MRQLTLFVFLILGGCASMQDKPEFAVQNPEQNFAIVKVNMEHYTDSGALAAAAETAKSFCTNGAPVLETQYDKEIREGPRRANVGRYNMPVGTGKSNRYFKFKCSL